MTAAAGVCLGGAECCGGPAEIMTTMMSPAMTESTSMMASRSHGGSRPACAGRRLFRFSVGINSPMNAQFTRTVGTGRPAGVLK